MGEVGLDSIDWETTRYLSAATQLDLDYARSVVRQVIGEPFRAVAPAAGVNVVVVTRWALAAVRRAAQRDALLTWLLILCVIAAIGFWSWIPLAALLVGSAAVVARDRWVRDHKIIAKRMLHDRFRGADAPIPSSPRISDRLDEVEKQQKGNVVVFYRHKAFAGSGRRVLQRRMVFPLTIGRKAASGQREEAVRFTNAELYAVLERAIASMKFPELQVGQRLFINGLHVARNRQILPDRLGRPVPTVSPSVLEACCQTPTGDARTYLCAEIRGWQGQLVVSMFARAIQANGSLQFDWRFQVLPPLARRFLSIDRRYELSPASQFLRACAAGLVWSVPTLLYSPFRLYASARMQVDDLRRMRRQLKMIRGGYHFNYGSPETIREHAAGSNRPHYFLAQDEIAFLLLVEHTMLAALEEFLDAHRLDLEEFRDQKKHYLSTIKRYNIEG